MKEILFYKMPSGKSPIDDFLDSLAKDIKLSTLENFAHSIGKVLKVSIA